MHSSSSTVWWVQRGRLSVAGGGAGGGFVDVTITRSTQATLFGTPA